MEELYIVTSVWKDKEQGNLKTISAEDNYKAAKEWYDGEVAEPETVSVVMRKFDIRGNTALVTTVHTFNPGGTPLP